MEPKKFAALDGMRGVAALLVLTRHTEVYWGAPWLSENHSYLAVDLFFMLSGFVISHAYAQKLSDGRLSSRRFMLIRWIRLWPLHALGALLGAAAAFASGLHAPSTLLAVLALMLVFLPARVPNSDDDLFELNGPAWSLFYEMAVNLLYALTRRWLNDRVLPRVLVVTGVGLFAIGVYNRGLDLGFIWGARSLAGGTLRAVFGIFLGVWLHRRYLAGSPSRRPAVGAWTLIVLMTLLLLLPRDDRWGATVDLLAVFVAFPLCVVYGARAAVGVRSARVFAVLGVASYPIYVLHLPLSQWLAGVMAAPLAPYAPLAGLLFAGLLTAAALALDRWYDQPVRRALTRWTAARKPSDAA